MSREKVRMAIAYDFDGTLAPGNMQEHQFLPDIGLSAGAFWQEVQELTQKEQADQVLVYMYLMLEKAREAKIPVKRADFKKQGEGIQLFEGVEGWFTRINAYAKSRHINLEHILISSGNAEIFAGTQIAKYFQHIYASKFMFDYNDIPTWPALAINYTTKTQYLFRINKGAHDLADSSEVNQFVAKAKRPVPFENMIYIGDGLTDIPCFRLVKEQGGLSIAVYKPHARGAREKPKIYQQQGRVQAVAPADYTEGSQLDKIVRARIDYIAAREILAETYDF